jgi:UDP-4-amino-4,6-dideoxy-N-acetyl-beta-L-altrosamine transaminase
MSSSYPPFLPYGRQWLDEDDIAAVTAALRSDWLTQGPAVPAFERRLAEITGAPHVVACSSGTAALHLCALALGLGPGDAVIVPTNTFLATANAVCFTGASPAFADVDPSTGLMGVDHAVAAADRAEAAGRRVRAVAPVHFAGQMADLVGLADLARARGWTIIEDACHALGSVLDGPDGPIRAGAAAHGGLAAFSFHPVKTITSGEGGAVSTCDPELDRRLRLFRNHGMERDPDRWTDPALTRAADGGPNPWAYEMTVLGNNYRLTDLQAALGLSQLNRLTAFLTRRRALTDRYREKLASLAPLVAPPATAPGQTPAWHLQVALIDFAAAGRDRAAVMAGLRDRGIGTQVHYIPVHRQPWHRERCGVLTLPGADAYYARALSLPLFPAMTDADVDRVVAALAETLNIPA